MLTKLEVFSSNESAAELPLGGFMANDDPIHIRNMDGLGPVKAEITSTNLASGRGEVPQGSNTGKRNIVLALGFNPDWRVMTLTSLRQRLYEYFMPEEWTKLRFFSDELPTVDIEGVVESVEPNIFSQDPEFQVSVICHKPDFIESDATVYFGVVDDGSTELEFDYIGTVTTGYELRIDRTPTNPSYTGDITVVTKSPSTPQQFKAVGVTIDTDQYFKLSSVQGAKRVQEIDLLDGETTNILSKMTDDSVWPQLKKGKNYVSVAGAEPGQNWSLAYFNRFGGL
jgi:hypothetical protein